MATDPICGMKVNEKTGLHLEYKGETFYFCAQHCLDKFTKEHAIPKKNIECCEQSEKKHFFQNKNFVVAAVLLVLILCSFVFKILVPFRLTLFMYLRTIWFAVIIGLFLGGIIDHFIPRMYISHILSKPGRNTILNAVILGFFMSACSHGILALSIQLHKKGASNPAVIAFLLASPWANMPLTIMLLVFFGFKALFIVLAAIGIAITSGLVFQILDRKKLIETNTNTITVDPSFSILKDIRTRWHNYRFTTDTARNDIKGVFKGSVALANMVLWWILVGMGIASFAGAYIPAHIFTTYLGPSVIGLLLTLLLATIIEVCSEGSAPMAFELFKQTGALGNSFVFLMAGVVTDYTEIGLIWSNVGRKTALWLPIVTVPQVLILGMIANWVF